MAWVAIPGARVPAQVPDQPAFRAGVDIVSLNVTAAVGERAFVTNLAQGDFEVFEDGVKQDVRFFASGQLPIALSLLLDTSASMETRMRTVQEAAVGFAQHLGPHDLAQVIDFDSRVRILQQFTPVKRELESAIFATSAGGSTALYNAIYISLKELTKMHGQTTEDVRREAVVVLSDGEDTSSLVGYEEVLDLAKRSETAIYAIGLRSEESGRRRGFNEAEFVLRQLSQETGGRAFFLKHVDELVDIYDLISEELSSQYTLGYVPKNPRRDGAWRRVVVRILRDGATARTKQGYYAPTSG
jgi:Ca-activated chloride channel family protein